MSDNKQDDKNNESITMHYINEIIDYVTNDFSKVLDEIIKVLDEIIEKEQEK